MGQPGLGVGVAAHHPRQLPQPGVTVDDADAARGDAAVVGLVHDEVSVGERGDLRQVRDDDDLGMFGESRQACADVESRTTSDAGVDLVEDERGRTAGRCRGRDSDA